MNYEKGRDCILSLNVACGVRADRIGLPAGRTIETSAMITQHFRRFSSPFATFAQFLLILVGTLLVVSCVDDGEFTRGDPALQPSSACSPPCSGRNIGCFEDPGTCDAPPCVGCYEKTCPPENPIQSCAPGAVCQNGICSFDDVCNPDCRSGTHCVAGKCVPNYTTQNVCDPLENCRNQCGGNAGCLASCENDRSSTCRSCIQTMSTCENRNSCSGSSTGCCKDEYCSCFPSAPGCGGSKPCAACWNQCESAADQGGCFSTCAGGNAACATCLQPWSARPECKQSSPPDECDTLFFGCIE